MMQKYISLLILATSFIAPTSANEFYLKTNIGMNYIPNKKIDDHQSTGSLKLKQPFPVIGLGIGYEFDNRLRIETIFDYYFLFTQQEKSKLNNQIFNINLNTKISDVMLNLLHSYQINEKISLFYGCGVGLASIIDEATGYSLNSVDLSYDILQPTQGKHTYNIAYKLTKGISFHPYDNLTGEIAYSFYDLGKSKPRQVYGEDNIKKRRFLIHNFTLGFRLKI
jgi:opacity protein-like surface antigen